MNITIKINTDNDAFSQDMNFETSRILEVLAKKILWNEIDVHVGEERAIHDTNGNRVGAFTVTR